jgi:hypothetical protein
MKPIDVEYRRVSYMLHITASSRSPDHIALKSFRVHQLLACYIACNKVLVIHASDGRLPTDHTGWQRTERIATNDVVDSSAGPRKVTHRGGNKSSSARPRFERRDSQEVDSGRLVLSVLFNCAVLLVFLKTILINFGHQSEHDDHNINSSSETTAYSHQTHNMSDAKTFRGSCHCEAIKFTVNLPQGLVDNGTCNCSHCSKRGIIWQFAGAGDLKLEGNTLKGYQFGAKSTTHQVSCVTPPFASYVLMGL